MTYVFQAIDCGGFLRGRPTTIGGVFPLREEAKTFGLDWLKSNGYDAFCVEDDNADDGVDVMTLKHRNLYQFAVNQVLQ
jgi:hypothetical protein